MQNNLITEALGRAQLEPLIKDQGQPLRVKKNETFLMPGQALDGIFYICSGRTSHFMLAADGGVKLLYSLSPGWFFGESSFFLRGRTNLLSRSDEDCLLYRIDRSACNTLMQDCERFRQAICECQSKKLLIMRYELANLSFNPCKSRLEKLLFSLVDQSKEFRPGWYLVKLRLTHHELGEIVGGTRVTVSRSLNELKQEGIIQGHRQRILVNAKAYHARQSEEA